MEHFNIVTDGPVGAGKGTITKLTVGKLGFVYVNTGAMYRPTTLYSIRQGISSKDEEVIARACSQMEITIRYVGGAQQIILNGEDVSGLIRSEEVRRVASTTSVRGSVRQKPVQPQKQLAREADAIVDGRDIGTCVLPDVPAKIYPTASVEIRIRRCLRKLEGKGVICDIREIEKDIEERDHRDMHREDSPLRQVEDVVLLGSSHTTVDQIMDSIIHIARERGYEG